MTWIKKVAQTMRQRSVVSSFICTPPRPREGFTFSLFKRSDKVRTYRGKWAVCSGSIETTDPNPETAARREIEEETTLTSADIALLRRGKPFSFVDEELKTQWTIHPFAFQLKDGAKDIQIDWEHTEYRFIKPSELQNYDTVANLEYGLSRVLVGPETEAGLKALNEDHVHGAHILALSALETLLKAVRGKDLEGATTPVEFWKQVRMAAWHLAKNGRPSMSAAIESVLFKVLDTVRAKVEESKGPEGLELAELKTLMETVIEAGLAASSPIRDTIGESFVRVLVDLKNKSGNDKADLSIVTLSSSSTITQCFTDLIWSLPAQGMKIKICVLESRPLFEGVSFANALLDSIKKKQSTGQSHQEVRSRLSIEIMSDASVALAVKDADFVVIGADKVSANGDVRNKIGSLTTAIVAKTLQPACKVVAVFDTNKIIAAGGEEGEFDDVEFNDPSEIMAAWNSSFSTALRERQKDGYRISVKNGYFESVPAKYIDGYVSEAGCLLVEDIAKLSWEKKALEDRLFNDI